MRAVGTAICALILSSGCATMSTVIDEKKAGGGTTRTYPVSFDDAWRISIDIFRREGTGPIEEHKAEGCMLTEASMNFYTAGTVMGAWFVSLSPTETRVTVVTQRRMKTNVFTVLTEGTYHDRFAEAVERLKAGKPITDAPVRPPPLSRGQLLLSRAQAERLTARSIRGRKNLATLAADILEGERG